MGIEGDKGKVIVTCLYFLVVSRIPAELSLTPNPVNLQENAPAGTELSEAYDPAVKGNRNAYRIINHLDEFRIDPGE